MDKTTAYPPRSTRSSSFRALLGGVLLVTVVTFTSFNAILDWQQRHTDRIPINASQILQKCQALHIPPGPSANFHGRTESDRYVPGTPPTLIKNATIWTGRVDGHEAIVGDLLLDKGIIKEVGSIPASVLRAYKNLAVVNAGGAWITPGIVDMHSHLGVNSSPSLRGAADTNSRKGLILPWLRSLDGLNTHDDAYQLSISGGVTTANVLPGSADAIGGQAFTIKLRPTFERSSSSLVLEPPHSLNGTEFDPSLPPRWRQMKHACGENPSRVYSGTRMDTIWAFRQGYDTARKIKQSQDTYCQNALAGKWSALGDYPEDLQWEALVDVLRGRVKVHNHCYEAVDLDGILTNEFKFSVAAFHHAHETYLVPGLVKKAYGQTPAIALFATDSRYKREAYRGSEFAPRILADNGLRSDHPVLDSRHLLFEAQQAHFYGLPTSLALASVTTTPAAVLGYDHRIGFIKKGYDADVVIWDSHPLALGATPKQVFIDGIVQLQNPHVKTKPEEFQQVPKTPDFTKQAEDAVKYNGLPPLELKKSVADTVIFTNLSSLFLKQGNKIREVFSVSEARSPGVLVVEKGQLSCFGTSLECQLGRYGSDAQKVDLEGGSITPALISYGSPLGLNHIDQEASTNDGSVYNPLSGGAPSILGQGPVIRAVDGLQFSTRDALWVQSTEYFRRETALHIELGSSSPSVSTHISALRRLLLGELEGDLGAQAQKVIQGEIPLVIQVQSADIIATLIKLKQEVETFHGTTIQLTLAGANEAHLLAKEIGQAGIGVILAPSRSFPGTWRSRRILAGPPLTEDNSVAVLSAHNVTAALEAKETLSKAEAIALASVNLERLLGVQTPIADLIALQGGSFFDFESNVVAVISPQRKVVELLPEVV
ncbi:hypothetical protein NLJ89_g3919 [Agrocybe chaxingu]|uniref:Amidohydrolase-related domain-containing protein n=1 Tax=Agrocybe chaxingu TaxID=84603 RepID=A0A9W8K416_9AGAR|nr:hypothetical protein NLJ89_g3919 [Agrocybe chaxingu]